MGNFLLISVDFLKVLEDSCNIYKFARLTNEVSKFCFYLKGRIKGQMFAEICLRCAHNKLIIIILERADRIRCIRHAYFAWGIGKRIAIFFTYQYSQVKKFAIFFTNAHC